MLYILTLVMYVSVFLFSLLFYSTHLGERAIYYGSSAIVIDVLAIVAGGYTIRFSYLSYFQGVDVLWVFATITIGSVVSAMHLAKWLVRYRSFASAR